MSETATQELVTNIEQEIDVNASPEAAFQGVLAGMRTLGTPEGNQMSLSLEEKPGGRWFRDLGNDSGHLWGHVQSIKAPSLLEISGPLFMSFAVANNLIIRVEATDTGSRVSLRHQCLGPIPEEYREGLQDGWSRLLQGTKTHAE